MAAPSCSNSRCLLCACGGHLIPEYGIRNLLGRRANFKILHVKFFINLVSLQFPERNSAAAPDQLLQDQSGVVYAVCVARTSAFKAVAMDATAVVSNISSTVFCSAPITRTLSSSACFSSAGCLLPKLLASHGRFPSLTRCIAEPAEKTAPTTWNANPAELQAADIIGAESQLFVQTYARSPVVFVRGEGCKLYDTENKEYLDLTAGIAVNALGHGDPTWVQAVTEQAGKLAHVSNLFHTVPQVKLAERLVGSSFADRVFMANSGTEANEAAMKFSRKYHHALAKKSGGISQGATEFIAFTNGFHGRTLGALSLTSKVQYRTPFEPLVPGAHFLTFGDLEAVKQVVVAGRTAAIFVEPLQGEGGINSASAAFLKGLRELCDETDTILIFDEAPEHDTGSMLVSIGPWIQCGLGRTGRLWAHEAYDVKPDIMTLAKPLAGGLPIGAVLVTERVASSIAAGDHGSTFAGGPLVCHAALAVLDRIQAPGFLESVAQKGAYLQSQLREKLGKNPHVKEVRGEGLLVGIQLDVPASPIVAAALKAGLLILTAGKGDIVRLAPPLIISYQEIDQAVEILESCMFSLQ